MTDKQIIDEIDISKCEFCEDSKYCYIYSGTADFKWMCKENEDCQIKNLLLQLKAKEQECEELKKTIDDLLHKPEIQDKILWKIDNEALLGSKDAYIYKLEQTLTEIKEIAKHCIKQDICTTCDNSEKCHIEDEEIPTYDVCKLILQKISEVENGNNG